jgi:membrane protease YdiL (CAAX protease family)
MFAYARFLFVLLNMALVAAWIVLAVLALVQLRRMNLNETTRAIWAALVVVVPILGAIAFWIVRPGQESA